MFWAIFVHFPEFVFLHQEKSGNLGSDKIVLHNNSSIFGNNSEAFGEYISHNILL
jgi:hypothetical protein